MRQWRGLLLPCVFAASAGGCEDFSPRGRPGPDDEHIVLVGRDQGAPKVDGGAPSTGGADGVLPEPDSGAPAMAKLCSPCTKHEQCGNTGDLCLKNSLTGETFCGQDCSTAPCPAGYQCAQISKPVARQCVPVSQTCGSAGSNPGGTPPPSTGCPALDELRQYNLQKLNSIRAGRGLPAFTMDSCLNGVAQQAVDEYLQTKQPHGKFTRECASAIPNCACNWQQENLGWAAGNGWQANIDMVLSSMMAEGPGGGHHDNIVSTKWKRVGIGIKCSASAYGADVTFVNDFGP